MPSFVNIANETHGGEDVVLYAIGPMAELFGGQIDNTFLAYGMAAALCVGPAKEVCKGATTPSPTTPTTGAEKIYSYGFLWILLYSTLKLFENI